MRLRQCAIFAVLFAQLGACAREYVGEDPPTQSLHFPLGVAVSADGKSLFVVSSNFDLGFNRGAVHAVDLEPIHTALASTDSVDKPFEDLFKSALLVPSFGGQLRLSSDGLHGFMPNRYDGALLEFEIEGSGAGAKLTCGDRGATPQDCGGGDHVAKTNSLDAFALYVAPGSSSGTRVYVGSLGDGTVSVVDVRYDVSGAGRLTSPFSIETELNRASGMAYVPTSDAFTDYLLISGEYDPELSAGETVAGVLPTGAYLRTFAPSLGSDQDLGTIPLVSADRALDARVVILSPDNSIAYVAQRSPDSVAAVDLRIGNTETPRFRVFAVQSTGRTPTSLAIDDGAPMGHQVLVACFSENALYALDGQTLAVRSVLRDLSSGPSDISVDVSRGLAYVSLFADDTIAVISLDRETAPGLSRVATIGTPRPLPAEPFDFDPFNLF